MKGVNKMAKLNGQSLLVNAVSGLTNTYSILSQSYPNGVTLEDLNNSDNYKNLNLNKSFLSYLSSNFQNIDKDKDGVINANDITNLTNNLNAQGLSYNELVQLCSQNGLGSSSLLSTVLTYFNDIDTNGDGKVSNSEITAWSNKVQEEKVKSELNAYKPSNMSLFYVDDTSSDSSSILDGRYPDLDNLT